MVLPTSPPPVPPHPPGSRRDALADGLLVSVLVSVLVVVVAYGALGAYASWESTHDLPNPWWATFSKSFRYRPEQGPPSPVFFVVRPEVVARQYVMDYIGVAGTFPCAADLASIADPDQFAYFEENGDPVLSGTGARCSVHRPVARVDTPSVYVGKLFSYEGELGALVDVQVTYTDRERWSGQLSLDPQQGEAYAGLFGLYYGAVIHETCWQSPDYERFYPQVMARVPAGVGYLAPPDAFQLVCQT